MNKLGFTERYLKTVWDKSTMDLLSVWMYGKTVSVINEEITFYYIDIQNFCCLYDVLYPI